MRNEKREIWLFVNETFAFEKNIPSFDLLSIKYFRHFSISIHRLQVICYPSLWQTNPQQVNNLLRKQKVIFFSISLILSWRAIRALNGSPFFSHFHLRWLHNYVIDTLRKKDRWEKQEDEKTEILKVWNGKSLFF